MVYIVFNLVERSGITTDLSSPLHFQFFRHLNMAKSEMRAKDEKFQSSRHVHFSDIRLIPVKNVGPQTGENIFYQPVL